MRSKMLSPPKRPAQCIQVPSHEFVGFHPVTSVAASIEAQSLPIRFTGLGAIGASSSIILRNGWGIDFSGSFAALRK
jgi:hypothetical protein